MTLVTGTFKDRAGAPLEGTVDFTASATARSGGVVYSPRNVSVPVTGGVAAGEVVPTDEFTRYTVELLDATGRFMVLRNVAVTGASVDVADLVESGLPLSESAAPLLSADIAALDARVAVLEVDVYGGY